MEITTIPAKKRAKPRVCAYVRVSTDSEAQEDSFEFQSTYWRNRFESDDTVEFVGVYADEGISGKSARRRKQFLKMIEDVKNGLIDQVYTKSISRFARNYTELIEIVRDFRDRQVPVIFESQAINTLDPKCGILLTAMASLAEEELLSMSKNQQWAARKRFANGSVELARLYGYKYVDRKLVIVPEEAEVVRRIFDMYINGMGQCIIARILTEEGVPPRFGARRWYATSIYGMIMNEKYMGDSLLQKSVYHLRVKTKNEGQAPQYYITDSHEGIISKETFRRAQEIREQRRAYYSPPEFGIGKYPLTGKIHCAKCGTGYRRKTCAKGTTYECIKWSCTLKDKYGKNACASNDIKDEVVTRLLIEAFNEAIEQRAEVIGTTEQEAQLRGLLATEQELKQLRVRGYITEEQFKEETEMLLAEIREVETVIKAIKLKNSSRLHYQKSDTLTTDMTDFLVDIKIDGWTATFEFANGFKTTKQYTNGRAGNVNGKLCKQKT